jgi:hypothetical protein
MMAAYQSKLVRTDDVLEGLEEELVKNHGDMTSACAEVGVNVAAVYFWMEDDSVAASRIRLAQQIGWSTLENAAYERAVKGVEEAVYYQGAVCGYKTVYSDGLLSQMLKARNGAYRQEESTGPKVVVNLMPRAETYEEWVGMRSQALRQIAAPTPEYASFEPVTESALRDVL